MEIEGVSTFLWEHWILCDLFQYLQFIVLGVDLVTWSFPRWKLLERKKPIHELVIEILLAFYLLSCFDFSRAYLSCLSSKEHFYTCANKQWSVHEGHSTVAVCEGCSERLSFNTTVHGKPNFQLYVSAWQVFLFPVSMLQGNSEYSLLQVLVSLPRFIPFHPFLCQV